MTSGHSVHLTEPRSLHGETQWSLERLGVIIYGHDKTWLPSLAYGVPATVLSPCRGMRSFSPRIISFPGKESEAHRDGHKDGKLVNLDLNQGLPCLWFSTPVPQRYLRSISDCWEAEWTGFRLPPSHLTTFTQRISSTFIYLCI